MFLGITKKFPAIIASFFGVGFIPIIPATWASALTALLAWYLYGTFVFWLIVFTVAGFAVCRPAQKAFDSKDPKPFVMDEVCGMMITLLWLPKNVYLYFWAFVLFRILDLWKPWPISKIDKSASPTCIMWDDIVAGVFGNLILRACLSLAVLFQ